MYKKQLLLLFGLFVSSLLFAQTNENKNAVQVGKYTVETISNSDNTYGYEIFENGQSIVKQAFNPIFVVPYGFKKKENALKVAKWHVQQLNQQKIDKVKVIVLPISTARGIGLTEEDLTTQNSNH